MKVFVLTLAILAASVFSAPTAENDNVEIDWSNVKPIEHYEKFWEDKPASIRPPASFFENLEKTQRSGRIVGGQIATPHQFPYQATVLMFLPALGGQALCGGSIIAPRMILTAAHCVEGATSGTIILGAHFITAVEPNQRRIAVGAAAIRLHPGWDPSLIRNDIALVQLPAAVEFNAFIRPAVLPTGITNQFAGETGVISGWGRFSDAENVSSDVLRYVYDDIISNTLCSLRFPGVIQDSNICVTGTNGRGACSGDSGGPLTVQINGQSVQTGVVSFGLALGCERAWPSVFARVSFFYSWIDQNLGGW